MQILRILTRSIVTLLLSLLAVSALAASDERQPYVITLGHQVPENIIPAIRPLLTDDDGISAFNDKIIVTTTPSRIDNIKAVIRQLDMPLHNLLITVRNNRTNASSDNGGQVNGEIQQGSLRIGTETPNGNGNFTVRSGALSYSGHDTLQHTNSLGSQQVRAVEGSPAFIATGESRVVPVRNSYGSSGAVQVDAEQGFYVTARLNGDRVTLEISARNDHFDPGSHRPDIATEHITSTVSGRVGEWISLGDINVEDDANGEGLVKKTTASSRTDGNFAILITTLD